MVTLLPIFIFFASFASYLFTAFPSIYWRDASEFQAVGFLLDIAHPAGSPLYAVIAKGITFIPAGSIAFKTTLVSAFFASMLSLVFYWVVFSILKMLFKNDDPSNSPRWIITISAMTTPFFSFSNALWENANRSEVYTFQNFFTAVFILILLNAPPFVSKSSSLRHHPYQLFYGLAFLYGLSLGAHAILILYLPLLFFWTYFAWLKPRGTWISHLALKRFFALLFFFILGFSIYIYLPIRSAQNPPYDWGNPETLENFIYHTTDRKDASVHFDVPKKSLLKSMFVVYWNLYRENFSLFGVGLGIFGFAYLIVKKRVALLSLFGLIFIPPFVFFIRYWTENSAYIPTFLITGLLFGTGLYVLSSFFRQNIVKVQALKGVVPFFATLMCIQFFSLYANHYNQNSQKMYYWETAKIMKGMLGQLDPGSIMISYHSWFGLTYMQKIEGRRPDITLLSLPSFLLPKLFTKFETSRFQNIEIPISSPQEFGSAFLTQNVNDHKIYWEPVVEYNKLVDPYLVPDGLVFRINPVVYQLDSDAINAYLSNLSSYVDFYGISDDLEEKSFYAQILSGHGTYFLERGVYEIALGHFKLASSMVPTQSHFLNMLGITYAYMEDFIQAESHFLKAISVKPEDYETYLNLATMFMHNGRRSEAEHYFMEVLERFPNHQQALSSLETIQEERGETTQDP